MNSNGVKYNNLFDFLCQKAESGDLEGGKIQESEFRDALMALEEENVISQVGHKKKPTIRFVV